MPAARLPVLLALLLAVAGCGESPAREPAASATPAAQTAPAPPPSAAPVAGPERRILAFGDSLFAGYGIGIENSYPTQLEAALRARGINARIVNAAVSGETSGAGRERLAFVLDAQRPPPELVLLELGGNDLLRSLPPAVTRANFAAMLGELKDRGIPVVLMGMRAPPNMGRDYAAAFDAIYPELAADAGATLVPFWMQSIYQRPELFIADRIHPTKEGVAVLVANTLDQVVAALPPPD